jgi:N-acetylneuraminic acid mutarotase
MKKSSNWRTALFTRRVLVTLSCAAVCFFASATLLAFLRPEAPTKVFHRALTFEERVSYQRTIEEVYWRHRIWPKECPDPKPSLDTVMSRAQLEKKVEDYLRDSRALEHYWQRPITAEQLQAEMNRMAQHTKQPDVLRELFEALGDDPFVVAECLARPALTERVLNSSYACDHRIHGQLRRHADSELLAHRAVEQMKRTSGTYCEIDLVKSNGSQEEHQRGTEHAIKLNNREWDETVQKLAATFSKRTGIVSGQPQSTAAGDYEGIPVGQVSPLQEDETGYYATAVTEKAEGRLKLATVMWSKEAVESWRTRVEKQLPDKIAELNASYTLPAVSVGAGGCANDTWAASSLNIPTPRDVHSAVWTGSEMIIWGGGFGSPFTPTNTGGRYNPSTDAWTTMTTVNAPSARGGHSAVWTGSEMIVWGGLWGNTGGRYNPSMDSWIATSTTNAPTGRSGHSAVWTGTQMIVWGGGDSIGNLNTGGRYNISTNSWTATSSTNAPTARGWHSTVWTGSEMIVWGGYVFNYINEDLNTGGRYNPSTDSWTATSTTNAPSVRELHTAVWTGSQMIVWGGTASNDFNLSTGARYDPGTDSWTATGTTNAPAGRYYHTAVWTGSEMIVWGGATAAGFVNNGSRYNPSTNSWAATTTYNAPPERWIHSAVWTGSEMIVWGGDGNLSVSDTLNTGGRYNPSTDTWAPNQPPSGRIYHTVLWTGSEMIVWGGLNGYFGLNTGGIYNPATDSWAATSLASAPVARYYHTAVWTGAQMIVWGGFDDNCSINSGGRYDLGTDSWTSTSTTNAPAGRSFATAVWAGNEMIVWGGQDCSGNVFGAGGRYNPGTDTWGTTTGTNAPTARFRHTAVWTGNEMIIWGGTDGSNSLNTGASYDPGADSWAPINMINTPTSRFFHTALWTGSQMIIWGGEADSNTLLNTGGKYDLGSDSWTMTSVTNAPSVRGLPTAVWTGDEMIVWGGFDNNVLLGTGGRYDPAMDSWTSTSTSNNAPLGRWGHTAIWSGSEMIVWGGINGGFGFLNNGGRYCEESGPPPVKFARLANISTRAFVQTGDNVMIGGLIVTGSGLKKVILRAIGPSLSNFGIANALQDPVLELHDSTGALIASNDNWTAASNKQAIIDSRLAPGNNLESAILTSLNPGSYTAVVHGLNNGTGTAVVEAYDLDQTAGSKFGNISTRALAQTGDNVMIGGLIVTGSGPETVVVRAIGPSLAQLGVANALADPMLELHDRNGALIASSDNWIDAANKQAIIASSLAPGNNLESAILTSLNPGSYTAIVHGVNNGTGVALVEVFGLN